MTLPADRWQRETYYLKGDSMTPPKTKAEGEELTAQHTKEPWEASLWDSPAWIVHRAGEKFNIMCITSQGNDEANARRIVACVNALAGMADPEAEIARLKRYDETPKCHHGHVSLPLHLWDCPTCTEQLRQDKAELVAAAQKAVDAYPCKEGGRCPRCELVGAIANARKES